MIKQIDIGKIRENPKNPRSISNQKFESLKKSIQDFPDMLQKRPLICVSKNGHYEVLGGNMRLKALQELNFKTVPAMLADNWTAKQRKEFLIKDNVSFGDWSWEALESDWDKKELEDWGMDIPAFAFQNETTEDDFVIPDEIKTDIKLGDLFQIGEHRLMCGDSTKTEDVAKLMKGEKADMIFIDPPYGNLRITNIKGEVGKSNIAKTKQYLKYANEGNFDFRPSWEIIKDWKCKKLVWGGNYFPYLPITTSWIIWDKRAGTHSWYSNCEMAWTSFAIPAKIYSYIWQGMIREGKDGERLHPTQKPIGLISKIITDNISGDLIVDLFLGSGSTMVAAHQLGRRCFGMEISPQYVQVCIDRMKKSFPEIEIKKL